MIIKSTFYHLHLFTSSINYIFANCPMKNNLLYDHCWIGSKNVKAFLNSDRCELSIAEHCSLIKLVYFPPRLHLRCMANLPHSHVICWRMITVTIWCYQYIIIVEIPIIICNHKNVLAPIGIPLLENNLAFQCCLVLFICLNFLHIKFQTSENFAEAINHILEKYYFYERDLDSTGSPNIYNIYVHNMFLMFK